MLVSGVQKSDSGVHTYIFIFQSLFTCKLLQNWVEFPVLFSRPLLVIYFIYSSVYIREGNGTPLQYSCLENPMDGGAWWVAKSQTRLSDFTFTSHFHALEKEMATHSSVLAWRIPGTGEPGGLLSVGSHRVRHDWSNLAAAAAWVLLGFHWELRACFSQGAQRRVYKGDIEKMVLTPTVLHTQYI